ncbi:hypothetical protein R4Z10_10615 [Niallia sp. XMNu-256]|uniref:hypothetical protein n=1 Tax=Niallia sp. XMNu-256 TaxID=3082444 RepID=UPI0030D2259E
MLKTTKKLVNEEKVVRILTDIVKKSYEEIIDDPVLLCLECTDVDLDVATANHFEFQEAIKENFELDEYGDVIHYEEYQLLMKELFDFFIELHIHSEWFDYFPEGEYIVNGEGLLSDSEVIAPKGTFYAPFEEATIES